MNYNLKKYKFYFIYIIVSVLSHAAIIFASTQPIKEGYVNISQGRLYYQTFGTHGSPIIVLHGGPGGDHTYFLPQMLRLAKNHIVTFYDQRGSGKSLDTPMTKQLISLDQFVEDLENLRQHLGYEDFILLGFSWGGHLAMEYAIKYPDRVNSMILVSSSPITLEGQQAYQKDFIDQILIKFPELINLFDSVRFTSLNDVESRKLYKTLFSLYVYNQSDIDKINLNSDKKSLDSGITVANMLLKESWLKPNFDLRPKLKSLITPVLIIHGKEDPVPLWSAKETQKSISNSELYIIPNCGHFPFVEQPKQFFDKIAEFLK